MHDLDRALQEFESPNALGAYEFGQQEGEGDYETEGDYTGEAEYEDEGGYGAEAETETETGYEAESDGEFGQGYEAEAEYGDRESEAIFDELEEMEHAAALLEVQDEAELDHFFGRFFGRIKDKLQKVLPPGLQKALAENLKKVAQTALPKLGAALGNLVAPGVGGALGSAAVSNAAKMFGLELEGMSYEDQEFEVAKRLVNLGAEATRVASEIAASGAGGSATDAAKTAVVQAAQTHAPGLAAAATPGTGIIRYARSPYPMPRYGRGPHRRTGRWYRRGHRIVLLGV